jgi:uncharacterized lipoprotein
MRATLALFSVALTLAACGSTEERTVVVPQTQPTVVQTPPTVVVPQGASCPNGSQAVMVSGVYRC